MPSTKRRMLRRIALVPLAVLAALLLAELALQVWTAVANPQIYALDDDLGWRHARGIDRRLDDPNGRPVRFATDERGLRATPHAAVRSPTTRRVLVAGDSFTQGSQVEADELFTTRLERVLVDAEVWNAGVGGYSTLQELRALGPQLRDFRPDLVVLVVFENDFQDNLMSYYSFLGPRPHVRVRGSEVEVVDRPDPTPFERCLLPVPGALWWYEHSALYRALHKNLFLPQRSTALDAEEKRQRAALSLSDQRTAMRRLLAHVAETVHAADAELLLVAMPDRESVEAAVAPSHEWLAGEAATLRVPFVSLLAPLVTATAGRAYFAADADIHLTAVGHECVAAALREPVVAALRRGG
jgi:lysophospholipase L1-like esterase